MWQKQTKKQKKQSGMRKARLQIGEFVLVETPCTVPLFCLKKNASKILF